MAILDGFICMKFDKLIENTYELGEEDFIPTTPPQNMVETLEKEMTSLINKAELVLATQEDLIIEAEKVMTQQDPTPTLPPPPPSVSEQPAISSTPSTATPSAVFRLYPDLKPCLLEKESTHQEVVHSTQVWDLYGGGVRD